MASCSKNNNQSDNKNKTDEQILQAFNEEYKDNGEEMVISYMSEPRPTDISDYETVFKNMTDCGINTFFTWGYNEEYEKLCEKYNKDYTPYVYKQIPQSYGDALKPENIKECVSGFQYFDEPTYYEIDTLEETINNHAANYSDKGYYVNLNPCWLHDEGVEDSILNGHMYPEYVSHFCDVVFSKITHDRWISLDYYPLLKNTVKDAWLYSYETVAEYAKAYNATFGFYVANTMHYDYRKLNETDLRFMINVALTYGARALQYFLCVNYNQGGRIEGNGLLSADGLTKYDEYYMAQTVDQENLKWDHIFMNFDWQETMLVKGDKYLFENSNFAHCKNDVSKLDGVKAITSDEDLIAGKFNGHNDDVGYMITNFNDCASNKTANVTVEFENNGINKAVVYHRGEQSLVSITDAKIDLEITPGDAYFVHRWPHCPS